MALLLPCLAALASCTAAMPRPSKPDVQPSGWAADYDYSTNIWRYLRDQYNAAVVEGATAYLYIYSDRSGHCRSIRKMIARGRINAFDDVRITMLNYDRLWRMHFDKPDTSFDPGPFAAAFVKIDRNGGLARDQFRADLYLYHPRYMKRLGLPEPAESTPAALEAELKAFFEAHDEARQDTAR